MEIREERPEDIESIHRVNEQAFGQPVEANLVDFLRRAGQAVGSLVALETDRVVGHVLFSPVTITGENSPEKVLGLAPMAVLPELQKTGVGTLLVKTGLDQCRHLGYRAVVVLGHPDYYPRFGFVPASRFGLKCEYDAPDEAFMALELEPGALGNRGGTVKFHPEFNNA
ncbi:MAG: N-acetyltransferase [Proteobacteria bacterium]|nr:N-acetyltransferase [Pseudomonadota bacterium]